MPLTPPQSFRKTEGIHRVGLSTAKPAASDVLIGTLYFSTDTGVLERSDGTVWSAYAPTGLVPHHATHEPGGTDELVNAAWTNLPNIFTQNQKIEKGIPRLQFNDISQPVDARKFEIVLTPTGELQIQAINDAENVQQGAPLTTYRSGDVLVGRDLSVARSFFPSGALFPGRIDPGPGAQSSWWLGSHATWGLYSNTGIKFEGSINTDTDIHASRDIFEKSRTVPMGHWIDVPFNPANFPNVSGATASVNQYMLVGNTLTWQLYLSGQIVAQTTDLLMTCPVNHLPMYMSGGCGHSYYNGSFGGAIGSSLQWITNSSDPTLMMVRNAQYLAGINPGLFEVMFTAVYRIQ